MDDAVSLIQRWLTKCENYTGIFYIDYDFLVPVLEHFFKFYRSADIKRFGTTVLVKQPPRNRNCDILLENRS